MRTFQPNLTIQDSNEFPIGIVEITSLPNIQFDEIMEIRESLLERGMPTYIPYFLLLSPDNGFLWKSGSPADSPPQYQFPMESVMTRYFTGDPKGWAYYEALEWMALKWLMDLRSQPQEMMEEPDKVLTDAGLTRALHRALILMTKDDL